MQIDPKRLFDESIQLLTRLAAVMKAEIEGEAVLYTAEQKACEEAVEHIGSLIPTLRLARNAPLAPLETRVCVHCED